MSLHELIAADMRLSILRFLEEHPDYRLNVSVIKDGLNHIGLSVGRDRVLTELHWLSDQGLVAIEQSGPIVVAAATKRGVECARGQVIVPGVKRRGPGD